MNLDLSSITALLGIASTAVQQSLNMVIFGYRLLDALGLAGYAIGLYLILCWAWEAYVSGITIRAKYRAGELTSWVKFGVPAVLLRTVALDVTVNLIFSVLLLDIPHWWIKGQFLAEFLLTTKLQRLKANPTWPWQQLIATRICADALNVFDKNHC